MQELQGRLIVSSMVDECFRKAVVRAVGSEMSAERSDESQVSKR